MIFRLRITFLLIFQVFKRIVEVLVNFNIAPSPSIVNDKITISLYYNDKLNVENEKSRLDKFAVKCTLNEGG